MNAGGAKWRYADASTASKGRRASAALSLKRGKAAFEFDSRSPSSHTLHSLQQPTGACMAAGLKRLTQLDKAIEHQKVVAGTAFLMATITEQLFGQLPLQRGHGSVVHGLSCTTLELEPPRDRAVRFSSQ